MIQLFDCLFPCFFRQPVFLFQHGAVGIPDFHAEIRDLLFQLRLIIGIEICLIHGSGKLTAHHIKCGDLVILAAGCAGLGVGCVNGSLIGIAVQQVGCGDNGFYDHQVFDRIQAVFGIQFVKTLEICRVHHHVFPGAAESASIHDIQQRERRHHRIDFFRCADVVDAGAEVRAVPVCDRITDIRDLCLGFNGPIKHFLCLIFRIAKP